MLTLCTFRWHLMALALIVLSTTLSGTSPSIAQNATSTHPDSSDPPIPSALVQGLLRWVGEHSDYDISVFLDNPPTVRFCDTGDRIIYEGKPLVVQHRLEGFYDKPTATITLVKPWDAANRYNVSTLLHELVHLAQYHHKEWLCWQSTEWEAYKLQEMWLGEHGLDAGFNWLLVEMLSGCQPRDIHPAMSRPRR